MQINVESKPAAPAAYDARKKRLVQTIDRLYHRDARAPLQKMLARVHPADMAAILGHFSDPRVAARELVRAAHQGGGKDNCTLVLVVVR